MFFILPTNTFDMIFYVAPTKEIGLYCSKLRRVLTLGSSAMNEALQLFGDTTCFMKKGQRYHKLIFYKLSTFLDKVEIKTIRSWNL